MRYYNNITATYATAHREKTPLPKYKASKKKKMKICDYCGKEYLGHQVQKYCIECRDNGVHKIYKENVRKGKKREELRNRENNQSLTNTSDNILEMEFTCALEGCNKRFRLKVYPSGNPEDRRLVGRRNCTYPKFCEEHRNEYKRKYFKRNVA